MNEPVEFRDVQFPPDDAKPRPEPREPQFGATSPSMPWPTRVTRPRSQIVAGFETQELRLHSNNRLLAFRGSATGGAFPFTHPVIVASTSIHSYDPVEKALLAVEAVALSADRQWVDRMLIMRDIAESLWVAARLGGRFAMRWTECGVAVLDLASGVEVSHFAVSGRQLSHRSCPLLPDAQPGDVCKQHGGPWVSRSITAASHWNDRRRLYWDLVGCDEGCTTLRERHSASVPTRYDMWLGPEDIAQPERHNEGHCRICLRGDGQHVMGPGRARPTPAVITVTTPDGRGEQLPLDEPVVVSKGMIVEVGMDETRVWSALGRLLIDPTGGPEDPLDWSDAPTHWQTTDADLRSRCKGSQFAQRWVAIGPLRVTGVRADQRVLPLVFDLRRPGSGLLLQRTWVRAGAYRIGEVGTWRLSAYDGQESRIKVLDDRQCVLDTTVDWVMSEGLEALMALALEPYDPTGCEVLFDRRRHLALRDAVITDAVFNVETDDLRCRLDASSDYRRVRAALQHPSSDPDFFEQLQACVKEPDKPFRPL